MESSSSTRQTAPDWPAAGMEKSPRLSLHARITILLAIWICALVPLLFVRTEWFGRPLSDQQIGEYLHAEEPNLVEHALTQIGDRMARHDGSVKIWYADLIRLSEHHSDSVRALDASVMSADPSNNAFHDALRLLLEDTSRLVRFRAALALARFGDPSGRSEIITGLRPWSVTAPESGRIKEIARLGTAVRQYTILGRIDSGDGSKDVVAPVTGRVTAVGFTNGNEVQTGSELLQIDPGPEVIADVLAALERVGAAEDMPVVNELASRTTLPERQRQQAILVLQTIGRRVGTTTPTIPSSKRK